MLRKKRCILAWIWAFWVLGRVSEVQVGVGVGVFEGGGYGGEKPNSMIRGSVVEALRKVWI